MMEGGDGMGICPKKKKKNSPGGKGRREARVFLPESTRDEIRCRGGKGTGDGD